MFLKKKFFEIFFEKKFFLSLAHKHPMPKHPCLKVTVWQRYASAFQSLAAYLVFW